jgi:hypothetical protein
LIAAMGSAVAVCCFGPSVANGMPRPGPVGASITWTKPGRPTKPDRADWQRIRAAKHLRDLALGRHRTVRFRSFAAMLGLSELVTIHPLGPGPCATAVTFLYDNLLDLQNAYQGENWDPLRRLVAKGPSIGACAPPGPVRAGP